MRANEDWTIGVDPGRYDPILGESYQSFSRRGLSFQRSQNGGRASAAPGPALSSQAAAFDRSGAREEQSFFDGIDVTLPGIYRTLGKTAPPAASKH